MRRSRATRQNDWNGGWNDVFLFDAQRWIIESMRIEGTISRRTLLGATAVGAATLAGCGGDADPRPTPTPVPSYSTPVALIPGYEDPTRWTGRTLKVGAWGGEIQTALRERIFQPFSLATGCIVQELTASYDDLAASAAAGSPYLDVIIGDAFWAEAAQGAGHVMAIPDDASFAERFAPIPYAPSRIPAYAYAIAAGFRRDAVTESRPIRSWQDWGNVATFPGVRALPAQGFGSLEIALLIDGVERDRLYPLDVDRALTRLAQLAPAIGERWWKTGDQPSLWLSRQRADFAAAWHYRLVDAQLDGRPVDFIWDDALLVADFWLIANGSTASDVAADFIRYATTPEIQASLATGVPLGPVNPAAFALIDPRTARRLPTSPDHVDRLLPVDAAWWSANGEEANRRFDAWFSEVVPNAV